MNMRKKVYVVVETWDDEYDNVRAVFTDEQAARDFVDSQPGNWDFFDMYLDVEQPDDSMRTWRVSLSISYKRYASLDDTTTFYSYGYNQRQNAFFYAKEKSNEFFIVDVVTNRQSKAMQIAKDMRDAVLNNPERFPNWKEIVREDYFYKVGARYDLNTGQKIEEDDK